MCKILEPEYIYENVTNSAKTLQILYSSAVCDPPCKNGGDCYEPGKCDCLGALTGIICEDSSGDITENKKFCFTSDK